MATTPTQDNSKMMLYLLVAVVVIAIIAIAVWHAGKVASAQVVANQGQGNYSSLSNVTQPSDYNISANQTILGPP